MQLSIRRGVTLLPIILAFPCLMTVTTRTQAAPPQQLDIGDFPATFVDDVVVPVPSEIFSVMEKLGKPAWHRHLRVSEPKPFSERYRISLVLGTTIADGFLAVEARDADAVKEIGQYVLELAEAISVRDSVLPHCKSIVEHAEEADWVLVRDELDKAQMSVRQAMVELKDEQLAQLISLGGWLRGTEILTGLIEEDFNEDTVELLHQPDLLNYFLTQLGNMPGSLGDNDLVKSITTQLTEMKPLIDVDNGRNITLESVNRIRAITTGLVGKIEDRSAS